eukprot:13416548-Heterocapsa_arctica.AAC.1
MQWETINVIAIISPGRSEPNGLGCTVVCCSDNTTYIGLATVSNPGWEVFFNEVLSPRAAAFSALVELLHDASVVRGLTALELAHPVLAGKYKIYVKT